MYRYLEVAFFSPADSPCRVWLARRFSAGARPVRELIGRDSHLLGELGGRGAGARLHRSEELLGPLASRCSTGAFAVRRFPRSRGRGGGAYPASRASSNLFGFAVRTCGSSRRGRGAGTLEAAQRIAKARGPRLQSHANGTRSGCVLHRLPRTSLTSLHRSAWAWRTLDVWRRMCRDGIGWGEMKPIRSWALRCCRLRRTAERDRAARRQ